MGQIQKVYAAQDSSGHWYVIPLDLKTEFFNEPQEPSDWENDEIMDDYYKELEAWEGKFSGYSTGGDLNLVQLYAEI